MKAQRFSALLAGILLASSLVCYLPVSAEAASESNDSLQITVPFEDKDVEDEEEEVAVKTLVEQFMTFPESYQKLLKKGRTALSAAVVIDNFETVYPTIAELMNHGVYKDVSYKVDEESQNVADTRSTGTYSSLITIYKSWSKNESYKSIDAITHEIAHVCQNGYNCGYGKDPSAEVGGSWIKEGMADYYRFTYAQYPEGYDLPAYSKSQSMLGSYRITARFFVWIEENICPTFVEQFNEANRTEKYNSNFFTRITGYTFEEIEEMYHADKGRITDPATGEKTSAAVDNITKKQ